MEPIFTAQTLVRTTPSKGIRCFHQIHLKSLAATRFSVRCGLTVLTPQNLKEHLQQINTLRENIGWRGYGQKDPLIEYKNEAYNVFLAMTTNIRHSVVYLIFKSQPILKV